VPEIKSIKNNYWYAKRYYRRNTDGNDIYQHRNDFQAFNSNTPLQSHAIDSKMDDGKPNTGNVVDSPVFEDGSWDTTPNIGSCGYGGSINYGADVLYNINPATGGNEKVCLVTVKAGFN
jgi:hypothetical protein